MNQTIQLPSQQGYPYAEMIAAAAHQGDPENMISAAMGYHPMTMDYMVENGRANSALQAIRVIIALARFGVTG